MNLVVDASIVVKVIIDEPLSEAAEALLFNNDEVELLLAPELLLAEVGNVLWRHFRLHNITQAQIELAQATIISSFSLISSKTLFSRALELAQIIDHPIYDCFYLATAERWDTKFITDDRKFALKVHEAGFGDRVQLLQPD